MCARRQPDQLKRQAPENQHIRLARRRSRDEQSCVTSMPMPARGKTASQQGNVTGDAVRHQCWRLCNIACCVTPHRRCHRARQVGGKAIYQSVRNSPPGIHPGRLHRQLESAYDDLAQTAARTKPSGLLAELIPHRAREPAPLAVRRRMAAANLAKRHLKPTRWTTDTHTNAAKELDWLNLACRYTAWIRGHARASTAERDLRARVARARARVRLACGGPQHAPRRAARGEPRA